MRKDIRLYLTGDPTTTGYGNDDDALGGVASQAELQSNFAIIEGGISSLAVEFVSQRNAAGVGVITHTGSHQFTYAAPGDTAGSAVTVNYGDTAVIQSDNEDAYVRVTRDIDNTEPTGATLQLRVCPVYNNAVGMSEVSQAGSTEYRALILHNGTAHPMEFVTIYGDTGLEVGYETLEYDAIQGIADAETAPSGVTFSSSVIPPDIPAGESVGVWLKRTVAASATVEAIDYELRIDFDWGATLGQTLYYGGSTRVYDESLEGYELYIGEDAEPDFDAAPAETSATLPFSTALTPPSSGVTVYKVATRYRNKYDLPSLNVYTDEIRIDDTGDQELTTVAAAHDVQVLQAQGGELDVVATYQTAAFAQETVADQWHVFVRTDGTDPNPGTDTPEVVNVAFGTPVEGSVFPVIGAPSDTARLNYAIGPYAMGTEARVVVVMHNSVTDENSLPTTVAQATVNTGTAPSPQLQNAFGGRRWAYVRWYNTEIYGSGTVADPWLIWNINDLQAIGSNTGVYAGWTLSANYKLMQDIDAGPTRYWNGGNGFDPIGGNSFETAFSGSIDGNGFAVRGLFIDRARGECGIVGYLIGSGAVSNIGVVDCNITSTAASRVGAVVGYLNNGRVDYCYSTGSVTGILEVGGLVGRNHTNQTITNSYSHCAVNGSGSRVGGLCGNVEPGASLIHCYSTGAVGGVATLQGGLAGRVFTPGPITACFWDTQTSGQATSAAGTGKTTAEMQQEATFAGWDFVDIWSIDEGNDYPRLRITR